MKWWMWPIEIAAAIFVVIILIVCGLVMLVIDIFRTRRCLDCEHAEYGL